MAIPRRRQTKRTSLSRRPAPAPKRKTGGVRPVYPGAKPGRSRSKPKG